MAHTSYAVESLRAMSDAGTITPEGVSWLLGYDAGQRACTYSDAYNEEIDGPGDVPAGAEDAGMFRTGWDAGVEDWARDNH